MIYYNIIYGSIAHIQVLRSRLGSTKKWLFMIDTYKAAVSVCIILYWESIMENVTPVHNMTHDMQTFMWHDHDSWEHCFWNSVRILYLRVLNTVTVTIFITYWYWYDDAWLIQCGSINVQLKVDTEDSLVVLICGDYFPSIVTLHSVYSTQQILIID